MKVWTKHYRCTAEERDVLGAFLWFMKGFTEEVHLSCPCNCKIGHHKTGSKVAGGEKSKATLIFTE